MQWYCTPGLFSQEGMGFMFSFPGQHSSMNQLACGQKCAAFLNNTDLHQSHESSAQTVCLWLVTLSCFTPFDLKGAPAADGISLSFLPSSRSFSLSLFKEQMEGKRMQRNVPKNPDVRCWTRRATVHSTLIPLADDFYPRQVTRERGLSCPRVDCVSFGRFWVWPHFLAVT